MFLKFLEDSKDLLRSLCHAELQTSPLLTKQEEEIIDLEQLFSSEAHKDNYTVLIDLDIWR
jgi:hypothetical protein